MAGTMLERYLKLLLLVFKVIGVVNFQDGVWKLFRLK